MYAINEVSVKSAYIGRQTGKLGYVFDYTQAPGRSVEQAQTRADQYASGRVKGSVCDRSRRLTIESRS